jgi:hypothetical protein
VFDKQEETPMPARKYLLINRSAGATEKREPPSPAQTQATFAAFNEWKAKFKDEIVDMGGKLKSGGKVLTVSGVTDGPFAEAKEVVGGYMVVEAESYDRALEVARGICEMSPTSSIEIREIAGP